MARSAIGSTTRDLVKDSGSILWSIVKGEQLAFLVAVEFIQNLLDYEIEAVVIEAMNEPGQTSKPVLHEPAGVQTTLQTALKADNGPWDPTEIYFTSDVVTKNSLRYRWTGPDGVSNAEPGVDPQWVLFAGSVLIIQFPKTLGDNWSVQPEANSDVYGFFELRVTELTQTFNRTWKPVRGMVEIQFSPTDLVP